jgi:hypothetical protein
VDAVVSGSRTGSAVMMLTGGIESADGKNTSGPGGRAFGATAAVPASDGGATPPAADGGTAAVGAEPVQAAEYRVT